MCLFASIGRCLAGHKVDEWTGFAHPLRVDGVAGVSQSGERTVPAVRTESRRAAARSCGRTRRRPVVRGNGNGHIGRLDPATPRASSMSGPRPREPSPSRTRWRWTTTTASGSWRPAPSPTDWSASTRRRPASSATPHPRRRPPRAPHDLPPNRPRALVRHRRGDDRGGGGAVKVQ